MGRRKPRTVYLLTTRDGTYLGARARPIAAFTTKKLAELYSENLHWNSWSEGEIIPVHLITETDDLQFVDVLRQFVS